MSCPYSGPPVADNLNRTFTGHHGLTLTDRGVWDASETYNAGDYIYLLQSLPVSSNEKFYYVCMTGGNTNKYPPAYREDWRADRCMKSILSCKLRFPTGPLPFGGFPGIARSKMN